MACYSTFIRGMLDLTDDIDGGEVVPPENVVRYDGDDPYLRGADKGTATFSDIANGIALEEGFWLGDAFASGGSTGYDHKKMGITARGAWESVKRHFRELGHDVQSQDFTVVGIGDMAGDVFGNGMLLARHIRLVGAFNHRHVFIDPDPDPSGASRSAGGCSSCPPPPGRTTTARRSRRAAACTTAPRSWLLARGARGARDRGRVAEAERADAGAPARPVDLLWNGGIGTYVKAGTRRTPTPATRPTTRCGWTPPSCARR